MTSHLAHFFVFHPLFPSLKGLEPFCRFSWILICRVTLFTSFAIANQITVSSEEAKLILVGDGATQQTAQITGQFEKGVQTTGIGKVFFSDTGGTQDLPENTYD